MHNFEIEKLHEELFKLQDFKYRDFQAKLLPTVDKEKLSACAVLNFVS